MIRSQTSQSAMSLLALLAALVVTVAAPAVQAVDPLQEPSVDLHASLARMAAHVRPGSELELRRAVDHELVPRLSLEHMSDWSAGRFLSRLLPAERDAIAREIGESFSHGLTALLVGDGRGGPPVVRTEPSRLEARGLAHGTVRSSVSSDLGITHHLHFQVHRTVDGWFVYDVTINGQSALSHYRSTLDWRLRRAGPGVLAAH